MPKENNNVAIFIAVIVIVLLLAGIIVYVVSRGSSSSLPIPTAVPVSPSPTPIPVPIAPTPTPSPTPVPPQSATPPTPSNPRMVTVDMISGAFSPASLNIPVGTTVQFINKDTISRWPASGPHPQHTTCPGFDAQEPIPPGGWYSFTFTVAKTCPMHDHLRPQIKGTIVVKAAL